MSDDQPDPQDEKAAIEKRVEEEAKKRYEERHGKENLSGLSPEEIKERTEKRIRTETEQRETEKKDPGTLPGPGEIDLKFVMECLDKNEAGDGLMYAALHQGKYVFNTTEQEWLSWAGHHWKKDLMNSALSDVENVSNSYLRSTYDITTLLNNAVKDCDEQKIRDLGGLREKIYKRVFRLRSQRGRQNCLSFSHTQQGNKLAVSGDCFDLDPWVLACSNGIVNLQTGIMRPGRPDDFILRACPHPWNGINEPAPNFQKFIESTFDNDQNLISFVQRFFGYCITGVNVQRKFTVLWGRGSNGKTLLIEILSYVLGPLAAPVQSEMLLDQGRARSSAAPSPDILALKGLRLAVASETDENRRFSSSRVKWLSGSDMLVGRSPHAKNEISFMPSHKLVLLTNNKPGAAANDYAFWQRIFLIPFKISFVSREPVGENERPADLYLLDKLRSEASGIIAWLVRGCILFQEQGLDPPAIVLDATSTYRKENDILADFLEECCYRDPNIRSNSSDLYDAFCEWFIKNVSKKVLSHKRFSKLMKDAGIEGEISGTKKYFGIGLLTA